MYVETAYSTNAGHRSHGQNRLSRLSGFLWRQPPSPAFNNSTDYWEQRYHTGGNSGRGSYGALASFKAKVLNDFVANNKVDSIIEFGCGDGNQLTLAKYPAYIGFDVSPTAIEQCRKLFATDSTKHFGLAETYAGESADLTASLDVIYHLVEDRLFNDYMNRLFDAAKRFVVVYATNYESPPRSDGASCATSPLHRLDRAKPPEMAAAAARVKSFTV